MAQGQDCMGRQRGNERQASGSANGFEVMLLRLGVVAREMKKHFQEGSVELQIPPLRYAPVGMTKGRATLPVCIGLWMRGTAGPSTTLRSGRNDKGERVASILHQLVDRAHRRS